MLQSNLRILEKKTENVHGNSWWIRTLVNDNLSRFEVSIFDNNTYILNCQCFWHYDETDDYDDASVKFIPCRFLRKQTNLKKKVAIWSSLNILYSLYIDIYIHSTKKKCEKDRNESSKFAYKVLFLKVNRYGLSPVLKVCCVSSLFS